MRVELDYAHPSATALDDSDIQILKTYVSTAFLAGIQPLTTDIQGQGPYAAQIKKTEQDIKDIQKRVNEKLGMINQVHGISLLSSRTQVSRNPILDLQLPIFGI